MQTTFGGFVRTQLAERGLSLRAFARQLGRSPGNVCNILRGTDYLPPARDLDRWADILELSHDDRDYLSDLAAVAHVPEPLRSRIRGLVEEDRVRRTTRITRAADDASGALYPNTTSILRAGQGGAAYQSTDSEQRVTDDDE